MPLNLLAAGSDVHADPIAPVLIALIAILAAAKLGAELAERLHLPAVLGELASGFSVRYVHLFIGVALCATSVGITARVFKDLGKVQIRK